MEVKRVKLWLENTLKWYQIFWTIIEGRINFEWFEWKILKENGSKTNKTMIGEPFKMIPNLLNYNRGKNKFWMKDFERKWK